MKISVKFLFLIAALAFFATPVAHAKIRVNEPAGAPSGGSSSTQAASAVTPATNGQCPANYHCSQCVHN